MRVSVSYVKARLVRNDNRVRAFDADLVSLKSTYQFSRFAFTRFRLDYDSTRNNYSGQALFGLIPSPGTRSMSAITTTRTSRAQPVYRPMQSPALERTANLL